MEFTGVIKVKKAETSKVNGGNRVELIATIFNKKLEGTGQIIFNIFYPYNDRVKSKPHTFTAGEFYYVNGRVTTVYYKPEGIDEIKSFQSFGLNAQKGALLKLDKAYLESVVDTSRLQQKYESVKSGKPNSSSHDDDSESDFQ